MPYSSPYIYCSQNPVNRIDPDGKKDYNFDKDGNYTGVTNDNFWHNLFHGSRGSRVDGSGKQSYFEFASGKEDTNLIDKSKKEDVHLFRLSANTIKGALAGAGVYRKENKENKVDFMLQEGVGGGSLDYGYNYLRDNFAGASQDPSKNPKPIFFLPEGEEYAHNQSNFGNFLISASAQAVGESLFAMRLGAHYNSKFNENGYKSGKQWDSSDDQLSIQLGYSYGRRVLSNANIKVNVASGPKVGPHKPRKR